MLRRSLVQDAFEYMQLPESAVSADLSQAEELAALVVRAAQEEADSIEVQLSQCQVSWSKAAEDPDVFHVLFDKLELPISLELASSSASTTTGLLAACVCSQRVAGSPFSQAQQGQKLQQAKSK